MKKLRQLSYIGVSLFSSSIIAVGSASASSISTTGPWSYNKIHSSNVVNKYLTNNNNVSLSNSSHQYAHTGDAKVKYNTYGGGAWTGDAHNGNNTDANVVIANNSGGGGGGSWGGSPSNDSIHNTGPGSYNVIENCDTNNSTTTNNNNVSVSNSNWQKAKTGDAKVVGNTYGGSASTGDASNYNDTDAYVAITNNTGGGGGGSWGGGSGGGSISNTGPGSSNVISSNTSNNTTVTNNNNVSLANSNSQTAKSGDAVVAGNTFGGSASTGNASNHNSTDLAVVIHNN